MMRRPSAVAFLALAALASASRGQDGTPADDALARGSAARARLAARAHDRVVAEVGSDRWFVVERGGVLSHVLRFRTEAAVVTSGTTLLPAYRFRDDAYVVLPTREVPRITVESTVLADLSLVVEAQSTRQNARTSPGVAVAVLGGRVLVERPRPGTGELDRATLDVAGPVDAANGKERWAVLLALEGAKGEHRFRSVDARAASLRTDALEVGDEEDVALAGGEKVRARSVRLSRSDEKAPIVYLVAAGRGIVAGAFPDGSRLRASSPEDAEARIRAVLAESDPIERLARAGTVEGGEYRNSLLGLTLKPPGGAWHPKRVKRGKGTLVALAKEGGRAEISLVAQTAPEGGDVDGFAREFTALLRAEGTRAISVTEATLGGSPARIIEWTVGDQKLRGTVVVRGPFVFVLTFQALAKEFDAHVKDYEAFVAAARLDAEKEGEKR